MISYLKYYFLGFVILFLFFSVILSIFGEIPKDGTIDAFFKLALSIAIVSLLPAILPAKEELKKKKINIFDFEKKINLVPLLKMPEDSYTIPINLRYFTGSLAKNIVWVENYTFRAKLRLVDLNSFFACLRDDYYEEEYYFERNYFDNHILDKMKNGYLIDNFKFNFYSPGEPYVSLSKDKVEIDFTDYLDNENKNLNGEILNLEYFQNKQIEKFNNIMAEFQECIDPDRIPEKVVDRFANMITEYGILSFKAGELNSKELS